MRRARRWHKGMSLLTSDPELLPPPLPQVDNKFRITGISIACWLVASFAHACALSSWSAGQLPPYRAGIFLGSFIGIGLVVGIVAVLTRHLLGKSNKTANIVFSVGVFVWAGLGALNVNGSRATRMASAAGPPGLATPDAARGSMITASRSSATSAGGVATPAPPPWKQTTSSPPTPQQQARATRGVFLARQYPAEQASAARVIAMIMDDDKPWQVVDSIVDAQNASPAYRQAYATWRAAEIRAGNDPQVTATELAAMTKLHEIRNQLTKYRQRNNNRPPALAVISGLPANPLTGHKSLAAAGAATRTDGWSYEESSGTMRIVLPPTGCAGLSAGEGEWPRVSK